LHDGDVDAGKKDLKQARADDYMHRHPEQINHDRYHDEAAADSHDRRQNPDHRAEKERHEQRQANPGPFEIHLQRHTSHHFGIEGFPFRLAALGEPCRCRPAHGLQAFDEHVAADEAEHYDVGHVDQEIGIAELPEHLDDMDPDVASDDSADQ